MYSAPLMTTTMTATWHFCTVTPSQALQGMTHHDVRKKDCSHNDAQKGPHTILTEPQQDTALPAPPGRTVLQPTAPVPHMYKFKLFCAGMSLTLCNPWTSSPKQPFCHCSRPSKERARETPSYERVPPDHPPARPPCKYCLTLA